MTTFDRFLTILMASAVGGVIAYIVIYIYLYGQVGVQLGGNS